MIRRPPRSTLFPTRRSSDLIVGSVSEKTMLDRVFREPALVDERAQRVMDPPFPVLQPTDDIERLYQELSGGAPALLAARQNRPASLLTKADLLEFVAHHRKPPPRYRPRRHLV